MLQQQLVHSDDIPRARIVDTSYKDHSMDDHDGRIGFSTKLKPFG